MKGIFSDVSFIDFEMDFWTFTIDEKVVINSTGVSIAARVNKCVKAFEVPNLKAVEYLPENISENFANLVIYEAVNCSIKSLNEFNFKNLHKLTNLNLAGNLLTEISSKVFLDLKKLKKLTLNHNFLTKIGALGSLVSLTTLDMSFNRFEDLRLNTFAKLYELRNLSLSDNRFSFFGDEHFKDNQKLEFIWMQNNQVRHLSYSMFNFMPNLKYVDFSFNSLLNNFLYEKH